MTPRKPAAAKKAATAKPTEKMVPLRAVVLALQEAGVGYLMDGVLAELGETVERDIVVTVTLCLTPVGAVVSDDELIDQIETVLIGGRCDDIENWVSDTVGRVKIETVRS